jgi:hypothetical protein
VRQAFIREFLFLPGLPRVTKPLQTGRRFGICLKSYKIVGNEPVSFALTDSAAIFILTGLQYIRLWVFQLNTADCTGCQSQISTRAGF